jgi:hypothetical protein
VSFAGITLFVASQRVFIFVSLYFFIDSVRKLLVTPLYGEWKYSSGCSKSRRFVEASGQLHAPATLPMVEIPPGTHLLGGWLGSRIGLNVVTIQREIPIPAGPRIIVFSSVTMLTELPQLTYTRQSKRITLILCLTFSRR